MNKQIEPQPFSSAIVKTGTGEVEHTGTGKIEKTGTGSISGFRCSGRGIALVALLFAFANPSYAEIETFFTDYGVLTISQTNQEIELSWHQFGAERENLLFGYGTWNSGYVEITLLDFTPTLFSKADSDGTGKADSDGTGKSDTPFSDWGTIELIESPNGIQGIAKPFSKHLGYGELILDLSNPANPYIFETDNVDSSH